MRDHTGHTKERQRDMDRLLPDCSAHPAELATSSLRDCHPKTEAISAPTDGRKLDKWGQGAAK